MLSATARWLPIVAERAVRVEPEYQWARVMRDGMARMVPPDALREVSADVRADRSAEREETA